MQPWHSSVHPLVEPGRHHSIKGERCEELLPPEPSVENKDRAEDGKRKGVKTLEGEKRQPKKTRSSYLSFLPSLTCLPIRGKLFHIGVSEAARRKALTPLSICLYRASINSLLVSCWDQSALSTSSSVRFEVCCRTGNGQVKLCPCSN